ncbi:DUF3558 domain-containing protein [Streptomyces sp. B6B3]|uniref:DUF3558 domain-containing protein n=1 Tax=Streptomyces sp. B6B3 TaxID=3153570 RepID=UPI00325D95D8
MQRSSASVICGAVRTALAAAAAGALVAGCSSGLDGTDDASGSTQPGGGADSAEPGRYSALPEPCDTVDVETLRELLPGGDQETYEGEPMETYDTGRRAGCEWRAPETTVLRDLAVDFERVVSYDPEISDDDQAALDFETLAAEAGISLDGAGTNDDSGIGTTTFSDATSGHPTTPGGELAPRPLDDIGHVAYVDDQLTSDDDGERREVQVAFRSSNVIVTVNYTVSNTVVGETPDSALLQDGAQAVARQLAGGFDD